LIAFMMLNKNKTDTTKDFEGLIIMRSAKQEFIRRLIESSGRQDSLDSVDNSECSFFP
jgi:hypothetical protein